MPFEYAQIASVLIPAHAGVIPNALCRAGVVLPYPRACGGDPLAQTVSMHIRSLSPRMRG